MDRTTSPTNCRPPPSDKADHDDMDHYYSMKKKPSNGGTHETQLETTGSTEGSKGTYL